MTIQGNSSKVQSYHDYTLRFWLRICLRSVHFKIRLLENLKAVNPSEPLLSKILVHTKGGQGPEGSPFCTLTGAQGASAACCAFSLLRGCVTWVLRLSMSGLLNPLSSFPPSPLFSVHFKVGSPVVCRFPKETQNVRFLYSSVQAAYGSDPCQIEGKAGCPTRVPKVTRNIPAALSQDSRS